VLSHFISDADKMAKVLMNSVIEYRDLLLLCYITLQFCGLPSWLSVSCATISGFYNEKHNMYT
jgi:hypothetical protein